MEEVGDLVMMTLEEMKRKLEQRNKMIEEARSGKDPICPKCGRGHIKCQGYYFFYCDDSECNMKMSLDPIRPEQK